MLFMARYNPPDHSFSLSSEISRDWLPLSIADGRCQTSLMAERSGAGLYLCLYTMPSPLWPPNTHH